MVEKQRGFARLNLARENGRKLEFYCGIPENAGGSSLSELLDDGDQFTSFTKYSRDRVPHLIYEAVTVSEKQSGVFLYVSYEVGDTVPDGLVPPELNRGGELLDRLRGSSVSGNLLCEVDFQFSVALGESTGAWFPLPFALHDSKEAEDGPVSEIRGIRGIKLASGGEEDVERIEYTFLLDRPENRDQYLHVEFRLVDAITQETPRRILAEARGVARRLGLGQESKG